MDNLVYFNQSEEWANFWIQSNDNNHEIYFFEDSNIAAYVYEYPLFMNKKFWYIPRGFLIKNKEFVKALTSYKPLPLEDISDYILKYVKEFLETVTNTAKQKENVVFIKFEIHETLLKGIPKTDGFDERFIIKSLRQHKFTPTLKHSGKKLQYTETKQLVLEGLDPVIPQTKLIGDGIGDFWEANQKWFVINFDKRTRYGTRKALDIDWRISRAKSNENFEAFYGLHQATSERQSFGIHNKDYLRGLFKLPFSRVIILRDNEEVPQAAWFGIVLGDTITHLYGGNSQFSRDSYGQYLLHLCATYLGMEQDCKYYDLGGLEEGKGFDLFKQGYRGRNLKFYGPFDIVLDGFNYNLYELGRMVKGVRG